eukprot:12778174-Prorocentrum_lima.AAC.1
MMEFENQIESTKPGIAISSDICESPLGEFDDSRYWEIGLLSGCPFFQPTSRVGGVTHLDGNLTGPIM